jgi:phosphate transport system substrate-binding protein
MFFARQILSTFLMIVSSIFIALPSLADSAVIKADGSSTVFPITAAVAEEFQKAKKNTVRPTVGSSGTGGGFKKFCRGETDVQNASRPITSAEMEVCRAAGIKFFELPIAFDAIALVVNPKNDWASSITMEEMKKLWEPDAKGKIMTWDQVNSKWPKEKMKLFGAGTDSGTFDYFTEAVNGKSRASRSDYTPSEDDNTLVQGVSTDKFAFGYIPFSYYAENTKKLKVLSVVSSRNPKGVLPTVQTVENGSYFPFSRPIFIYVSEKSFQRPEVKEFVEYYLKNAAPLIKSVKYVPLPAKAYEIGLENLKKNKLGTAFGGHAEVGMKIEELMKKETVQ